MTNVIGPIALTQLLAKHMLDQQHGRIVFMSSVAGLTVDPFSGAYSASIHAIEVFSEALYKETRTMGIDILTINPGPFLTGFNDRMFEAYTSWRDTKNHFDYSQLNFPHEQYDPELLINEASRIITAKNPYIEMYCQKKLLMSKKINYLMCGNDMLKIVKVKKTP